MIKIIKPISLFLLLSLCFVFASSKVVNTKGSKKGDVAIKGYDTVAYFTVSNAVKGDPEISHQYEGVKWYFSSEKNKELFAENPKKYIPAYGGYCAYAIANYKGKLVKVDPKNWYISDEGILYLNYSARIQKKWNKEKSAFIKTGDKYWGDYLKSIGYKEEYSEDKEDEK